VQAVRTLRELYWRVAPYWRYGRIAYVALAVGAALLGVPGLALADGGGDSGW